MPVCWLKELILSYSKISKVSRAKLVLKSGEMM
jgi:hypothetical protein